MSVSASPSATHPVPGRFEAAVAVVIGGGSGIGAAVARRLEHDGVAALIVADSALDRAKDVASNLAHATAARVDVTDPASVDQLFTNVVASHERVDVIVHAAGVADDDTLRKVSEAAGGPNPPEVIGGLSDALYRRVMAVNLDGTFYVLRAAAQIMVPQRSGVIVTVGSSAGLSMMAGNPHYVASKAGAHALAQSVAKELIRFGVRVNVVAPGPVDTPMTRTTPEGLLPRTGDGRSALATPEQVADNIAYLASSESSNIVGQVLLSAGSAMA